VVHLFPSFGELRALDFDFHYNPHQNSSNNQHFSFNSIHLPRNNTARTFVYRILQDVFSRFSSRANAPGHHIPVLARADNAHPFRCRISAKFFCKCLPPFFSGYWIDGKPTFFVLGDCQNPAVDPNCHCRGRERNLQDRRPLFIFIYPGVSTLRPGPTPQPECGIFRIRRRRFLITYRFFFRMALLESSSANHTCCFRRRLQQY